MSMISELVNELRKYAKYWEYNVPKKPIHQIFNEAADTIETLSEKLQAANIERSTAYYNGDMIEPCEMLPKADEKVLVWIEYGTFSGFSIGSIIEDGRCLWDVDCLSGFFDKEVKAWWKLPEYKPQ